MSQDTQTFRDLQVIFLLCEKSDQEEKRLESCPHIPQPSESNSWYVSYYKPISKCPRKLKLFQKKILQRLQGSDMRLRSLDTEHQLSCAKTPAASQGFFWGGLCGRPHSRGCPPLKGLCLFLRLSMFYSTWDTAAGSSYTWAVEWDAQQGVWLGRVHAEQSHSHTPFTQPCSGTLGKVAWAGRRWKFDSAQQHAQGIEMVAGQEEK